jgi:hypothetical protein
VVATADITRFMNNARNRLPGALDPVTKQEFFATMFEFFSDSNCWREDVTFGVTPSSSFYEIEPDETASINRLMYIVNSGGAPINGLMKTPGEITLQHAPASTDTYTATVALNVTDPTDRNSYPQFPDWILNKYNNELLDGLLGRMMSQPAKPYSSERLSIFHTRKFRAAVAKAKVEANHANLYGAQAWRFPSFARGRQR